MSSERVGTSWRAPSGRLPRLFQTHEMYRQFFDGVPNIILAGLAGCGKTSVIEVVYNKASPHEVSHTSATDLIRLTRIENTNLIQFNLVDCPTTIFEEPLLDVAMFANATSMVFVIDAQNEPFTADICHCMDLVRRAWRQNPRINLEVFIHKVDGDFFSVDEVRAECQRDIHDKLLNYMHEEGVVANVSFYCTSVYDQSIIEACSRVVQKLVPNISGLEQLLDVLVTNCRMEKAFLIDVASKTFIATDSSPFSPFHFELCIDMIDMVIEIFYIYGPEDDKCPEGSPFEGYLKRPSTTSPETIHEIRGTKITSRAKETATVCLMQLSTGHIMYMREMDQLLVLTCVIREDNFDRQYLVDYNMRVFRDAILKSFSDQTATPNARSPTE